VVRLEDVRELFNRPLSDAEIRRAVADLEVDPHWSVVVEQEDGEALTLLLVHAPTGSRVRVVQERSIVGMWNSTI
jgi:hypothetical protein